MEPVHAKDVTILWHGWLKRHGRFSKRWKRQYAVFFSMANGMKELRQYDAAKDVSILLASTPKSLIPMTDVSGICCFLPAPPTPSVTRKHNVFQRSDTHDFQQSDSNDQKFVILTPLHAHLLAFSSSKESTSASDSQQGLSLLASLSAFYPTVDVLHTGFMSKKRERTNHSAAKPSMISYWKRHFFAFLSSGDLLYFRDDTLDELQGRVDVRHAPTVRATGEHAIDEKRKDLGAILMKFAKLPGAGDRDNCLVWIATPPSKMFVLKVQEDQEGLQGDRRRQQMTASAKKWLSLLLQGHAETKYSQLEQCIASEKYEATPEIISAIRAGIPDELRGQLWKGFSAASDLERRAKLKQTLRKISKTTSIRALTTKEAREESATVPSLFEKLCEPLDSTQLGPAEYRMITSRLCAVAMHEAATHAQSSGELALANEGEDAVPDLPGSKDTSANSDETEDGFSDSEHASTNAKIKQLAKGTLGHYLYPSDSYSPSWEVVARRRLLIACSRYNPYSHPCAWKVVCLLLAYLDEESTFWVVNSIQDVHLPGYFHGHRPALQIDASAFISLLQEQTPALMAHLRALTFPVERTMERWFLSMFTSTQIPLPTVLRIWDAFFAQGIVVFFGVGIAFFLRAQATLFQATSAADVQEMLDTAERTAIDSDALFSHVFSADLNIPWLSLDRLERVRVKHRQRIYGIAHEKLELFKEALSVLGAVQDHFTHVLSSVRSLQPRSHRRGSSASSSVPASTNWNVIQLHDEPESEVEGEESLVAAVSELQLTLTTALEAISTLDTDLNARQAQWLALSSQLSGCPVALSASDDRITPDLQSWLSQVKEGKVSGAGIDKVLPSEGDWAGILFTSTNDCGMFLDALSTGASCLIANTAAFASVDRSITDNYLLALVAAVESMCAVRFTCVASAHRTALRHDCWIQSPIELHPVRTNSARIPVPSPSSSRNLRRAASSASKPVNTRPHQLPWSSRDDRQRGRGSLDDSVLRTSTPTDEKARLSTSFARVTPPSAVSDDAVGSSFSSMYVQYDSTFYQPIAPRDVEAMSPSGDRPNEGDTTAKIKRVSALLHRTTEAVLIEFSGFIRCLKSMEDAAQTSDLQLRASRLEEELMREVRGVEAILDQTNALY